MAEVESEYTIAAQGHGIIPRPVIDGLEKLQPRERKRRKWWLGSMGEAQPVMVVRLHSEYNDSYPPAINAIVGGGRMALAQAEFRLTVAKRPRLTLVTAAMTLDLGQVPHGIDGEPGILSLGGKVLGEQHAPLSRGVLSKHLIYYPDPNDPHWLGVTVWTGIETLTCVAGENDLEPGSIDVLKLLVPWAYSLVGLTLPPYRERE